MTVIRGKLIILWTYLILSLPNPFCSLISARHFFRCCDIVLKKTGEDGKGRATNKMKCSAFNAEAAKK